MTKGRWLPGLRVATDGIAIKLADLRVVVGPAFDEAHLDRVLRGAPMTRYADSASCALATSLSGQTVHSAIIARCPDFRPLRW